MLDRDPSHTTTAAAPLPPGPSWAPPFTVDVAWFEPDPGTVPPHLRPILLALYDTLQRPVPEAHPAPAGAAAVQDSEQGGPYSQALRPGVGIPVLLGRPLPEIARDVLALAPYSGTTRAVVVLLDEAALQHGGPAFARALRDLMAAAAEQPSGTLLLPVVLHPSWLDFFPWATPIIDMTSTPEPDAAAITRAVAVEIAQRGLPDPDPDAAGAVAGDRVSLFISRTASDRHAAAAALERLRASLAADGALSSLFDLRPEPPDRIAEALRRAGARAMLLALHTDHYAESPRCAEEMLIAKQRGIPVATLLLLRSEEQRSPPYSANMLDLVWRDGSEHAALDRLLRVWLHHLHFRRHGLAVAKLVGLTVEPLLLSRPPELLDFAQGAIPADRGALVLYPDPPLPTVETGVLQRAYPRVRLVTPTTLFGRLLRPGHPVPPLAGTQVSLSLSASPDVPEAGKRSSAEGLTTLHVDDLIAHLTLCLVRAGARLAYGGHLRRGGYTGALLALIRAHNQLGLPPAESLRSYVAAHLRDRIEIAAASPPIWVGEDIPADDDAGRALQLSRMRERMAEESDALIAMGGKTTPKKQAVSGTEGYAGRFPGVLEEAWRTLRKGKALFVIGGFGGAARWIADLLLDLPPANPELLDEPRLRAANPGHDALCRAYDAHPSRQQGDPESLDALTLAIRALGAPLRAGDEGALWTNGLSVAENRRLFVSRSAAEIAHLVMKGLLRREAERAKLRGSDPQSRPVVRLYQGRAADAPGVGAYALTVIQGTALSGDEAHLDERLGGALSARLSRGHLADAPTPPDRAGSVPPTMPPETLPARGQRLSGDWVCVATMAPPEPGTDAGPALALAARHLLDHAVSQGLFDLAITPWGLATGASVEPAMNALLDALRATPNAARLTLTVCESQPRRHDAALRCLKARAADVSLVVLPADPAFATRPAAAHPVTLRTVRIQDKLQVSLWAPADDAGPLALCAESSFAAFEAFGRSLRRPHTTAPRFDDLAQVGARLASLALPGEMLAELRRFGARPLDIIHDDATAGVPWETLCLGSVPPSGPADLPGLRGGVRRRLAVDATEISAPTGTAGETRRVLLIANPRSDLAGADQETSALVALLRSMPGLVVEVLPGAEATLEAVCERLEEPWDVLHYAGHAFFDSTAEGRSGLALAADGVLTAPHVRSLRRPPPFIFLNACQSARVREVVIPPTATPEEVADVSGSHGALARAFLTAGARLLIGNFWLVGDDSARDVARVTYEQLLQGAPVGAALLAAKNHLFAARSPDWANYVLYGDAAWQW